MTRNEDQGTFQKELYRDFDVNFHKKANMADISGDMGGVELIQNNNSNDDINDTGGDDDAEKRLVKA